MKLERNKKYLYNNPEHVLYGGIFKWTGGEKEFSYVSGGDILRIALSYDINKTFYLTGGVRHGWLVPIGGCMMREVKG